LARQQARLAAAAHQGWSANLFTLPSDVFARPAVGSVAGVGGTAGAIGGMLIAKPTPSILELTGSYVTVCASPAPRLSRRSRWCTARAEAAAGAAVTRALSVLGGSAFDVRFSFPDRHL